jgi:hypothetical protein
MKRIPEVLQFAVIIERGGPPSVELEPLQELDFLLGGIAAEGDIFEEFFQARLRLVHWFGFCLQKLKFLITLEG